MGESIKPEARNKLENLKRDSQAERIAKHKLEQKLNSVIQALKGMKEYCQDNSTPMGFEYLVDEFIDQTLRDIGDDVEIKKLQETD